MSLTASFTASESLGEPNKIVFVDDSSGTDLTITTRRIYIQQADRTYLVPAGVTTDYTTWNYADSTTTLDVLTTSTAATVTVVWYAGSTPVYTVIDDYDFDLYDYLFGLELLQNVTADNRFLTDTNWYSNFIKLIVDIFNSENAVTRGSDIYSAQSALDRNAYLIQNSSLFF